ncbi:glycosyltransferase family 32 protein [Lacrimispora sp.]|uniref:glycosyltransferase family 32 protein n=1 Tax=Lacrimispora sp. TaxID=2719234 RepID=UPI002897D7EF|nr:glycosyltransferase [Lacrimispora sp.]
MIKIQNLSIEQFIKHIHSKKVICFCAGQGFFNLCETFQLASKILYVVDNYKSGTYITLEEYEIPVLAVEEMGDEIKDCILVISTIKYIEEIITQLDKCTVCNDQVFYVPDLFNNEEDQSKINNENHPIIPKIIHYCWFGNGRIPDDFLRNIDTWKRYCPDYEIKCWNESNYDINKNKYMKQAYEMKKWGFVPDYARLDIVNSYGGIYLDTDVELLKSLDALLQFNLFCGFENAANIAFGLGFGSVKDNPIIIKMMESYEGMDFINPDGTLNTIPSPVYQTRDLEETGLIKNGKTQWVQNAIVLAPEYLAPINEFGYGKPTTKTFSIHHYAATWYDDRQKKNKDKIIDNYKYVLKRISDS